MTKDKDIKEATFDTAFSEYVRCVKHEAICNKEAVWTKQQAENATRLRLAAMKELKAAERDLVTVENLDQIGLNYRTEQGEYDEVTIIK